MRLIVVRHGVTDWNVQGRLQGRTDIDLNTEGIRQALRPGERLRAERLTRVFASPMRRATRTAMRIAEAHHLPVETDEALHEAHMGLWEGLTWEEVRSRYPHLLQERDRIGPSYKGHQGESVLEVTARSVGFLNRIRKEAGEAPVCIVTHASPGRQLILAALGEQGKDPARPIRLRNASVSIVDGARLVCLDDVGHLSGSTPPYPLP